jgi:adenylate kinase
MLNIALFGPPGAGKGTQSKLLLEKYRLSYIATGDILRQEIADGTDLGKKAKSVIEKGGLASDEIIVQIIEHKIKNNTESVGFLFDGFPRTVVQAYILEGLLLKLGTELSCMLSLEVHRDELIQRLTSRGESSGRTDDTTEVIERRLKEYEDKTKPVANFYQDQGKFYPIQGVGDVPDIFGRLVNAIESSLQKEWLNIVLTGRPGSGKGTQSKLLTQKYNLIHIATGDMLRQEVESETETGHKIKAYIDKGDLVPDEIVIRLIERKIDEHSDAHGFLFDGFPMNLVQAYILDGLLSKKGSTVNAAIHIDVPTLSCIRRLQTRWETPEARSYDKNTDVIIHRLEKFEKKAKMVYQYYKSQQKLFKVNGENEKTTVFEALCKTIDEVIKHPYLTR